MVRSKIIGNESKYDVLIVGAGVAGLSAAIWCRDLGLTYRIFEMAGIAGGQLRQIHLPITNIPGIVKISGTDLASIISSQAGIGNEILEISNVIKVETDLMTAKASDGTNCYGRSMIVATGVRRRTLGVPGEAEFSGKGILISGAKQASSVSGKNVVIVGGGDAAIENAGILAVNAESVTVVHRRNEFTARPELLAAVLEHPKIRFLPGSIVTSINGGAEVSSVSIRSSSGAEAVVSADAVLIRIGTIPNSELVRGVCEMDEQGFITTDTSQMTSTPCLYAIGDVANRIAPTIPTAIGSAATAVKSICYHLGRDR